MTDDDDNMLEDFDLSAWDAPAAPANLADGVIGRVMATDEAIAAMKKQRGSKRRWWVIGGVAATVAAAALAVWIGVRGPTAEPALGTGSGAIVADRPQRIELGTTSANVDPGARVTWTRNGSTLHVTQDAGAATWNVGPKDFLVIDAGATVAAVEAAGGSLRVEVRMNATDVKLIGASAVTAAAVAMVTVIVYEGHVKVSSAHDTVVVMPGSTVEVPNGKPPRVVSNIGASVDPVQPQPQPLPPEPARGADVVIPAGDSVTIHDPRGAVEVELRAACNTVTMTPPVAHHGNTFHFNTGHYNYSFACDQSVVIGILDVVRDDGLAAEAVAAISEPADGTAWTNPVHVAGAAMTGATVSVSGRGVVVGADHGFAGDVDVGDAAAVAIRVAHPTAGVHYYLRHRGTAKTVAQKPPATCDQDTLLKLAEDSVAKGQHAKALQQYEAALQCKADDHVRMLVFMESCNAGNVAKAKLHWKDLSETVQNRALQICVRNRITRDMLDDGKSFDFSGCDQEALLKIAEGSVALGNHGQALKQYEEALHCKSDSHTLQLTFMEACNANNASKAKTYWKKLSPELQQRAVQICKRNHITEEQLNMNDDGTPPVPACDDNALVEKGKESMALGNHGQALKQFEDAFRCKADPRTLQFAFIEACNANNVSKAKTYWKKLPVDAQNRALQICVRNHITRDQLDGQ